MSRTSILLNSFNTGEVSELIESRSDLAKYASACKTLENALPLVEGGAKKMPGTYFAGATALGGAMFTGSISGTTLTVTEMFFGVIQVGQSLVGNGIPSGTMVTSYDSGNGEVGTYILNNSLTVSSELIQIPSNGKSRLVPFQFSALQGAILEFSPGIVRIWEGASQGVWSLGLASQLYPMGGGGGTQYSLGGTSASTSATGTTTTNTQTTSGYPVVAVSGQLSLSVNVTASITVGPATMGGGAANVQYQYSPDGGTTWLGYFGFGSSSTTTMSQNVTGRMISGVTSLSNLQFRIIVTANSGGVVPPTVSITAAYGPTIVTVVNTVPAIEYTPATAYVFGDIAIVGPTFTIYNTLNGYPNQSAGILYITAPYGTTNATTVSIAISVNSTDTLSVTATGSAPNQGISIALANTTASKNAASLIEAAIQALGSLNSTLVNFVNVTAWTVTPDPVYFASPWITLPSIASGWTSTGWIAGCLLANQNDQFPLQLNSQGMLVWNQIYWTDASGSLETPIELTTPYLEGDLFVLDCSTQSADILWVFHPNYPPAVIERLAANSWQYSLSLPGQESGEPAYRGTLDVVSTGYSALGQNISLISQATTCVVVLASGSESAPFANGSRIYINECAGLVALNEGEFIVSDMTFGSVTITVIDSTGTSSTITATGWNFVPLDPISNLSLNSTSYLQYAGGGFAVQVVALFNSSGNYPACGALYQERLFAGGTNNNPTQLNGSVQDDYPDFISDPNEDDYAVQFTLVSSQVNQLLNMVGTPNGLAIGTSGGVWIISASAGTSISQTNVDAQQQTTQGVSGLQPQIVQGSAVFVSRSARIVTFLTYSFVTNQWENTDLTRLNRNITIGDSYATSGVAQTAFQMEPYPIFWAVRNDGQLIALVFNTQDQVYAWFRVVMPNASIESVAVISGQNQEDQVVVVVNRTINGLTQRYVEYFMPQELFGQLSNAFFVHSGLQFKGVGPFPITNITQDNPAVVTSPGHTLSNGQQISIQAVLGMTQVNTTGLNAWTVAGVSGDTFQLQGINSTIWQPYTSGGTVEQVTNQVTGMSHLIGQTVIAVGDEQIIYQGPVTSDTLNFGAYANQITIGLPYTTVVEPMNPVIGSAQETSKGQKQKFSRVTLSLYESLGGLAGTDWKHLHAIPYPVKYTGNPPLLFTGNLTFDIDGTWEDEDTFLIVHDLPFPLTLRSIVPRYSSSQGA